ncbi:restriction endonuclease subunit S [[Clostridium] innocuum]|nr:restriction endonuclease subunit S [[Clostridium] innocuum]
MTKHYTDEGTLLIRNSDIKDGKFEFGDNPIYLEKTFAEKNETRMHQIGDVITVHTGDVGTSAVITENEAKSIGFATIVTRPNPKIIDSNYLCSFLNTDKHKKWAVSISTGDGRTNYNLGDYFELVVPVPSIAEQKKIASYIQKLNRLITLHQCKCQIDGYRFQSPLAITWEQRKFSDLVQIERGGSPRPIDDFITDSPDGLNWVKIGDAPAQGNYITKTAEKIKPEGLSKTREVHPGDLILSNSMSFGKPYIMGIDGCIHDGWLLIRNTYKAFDLTFLCHLLGTPQMIIQYKSLAAGSTVNNLNKELVGNTVVTIPTIKEQRVLGQYLETLDNLITLHQCE